MAKKVENYKITPEMRQWLKGFRQMAQRKKAVEAEFLRQVQITQTLGEAHQELTQTQNQMINQAPPDKINELIQQSLNAPEKLLSMENK